jgi:hypothetical protein
LALIAAVTQNQGQDDFLSYASCGIILVLLISTEPLKFLGQPERYLEFSMLPMFAYLSHFQASNYTLLYAASLIFSVLILVKQLKEKMRRKTASFDAEYQSYNELSEFLDHLPEKLVILTLPDKCSHYLVYLSEKHRYINHFIHAKDHKIFKNLYPEKYPLIGNDFNLYKNSYNIDLIILYKPTLAEITKHYGDDYYQELKNYPILFENNRFKVFTL